MLKLKKYQILLVAVILIFIISLIACSDDTIETPLDSEPIVSKPPIVSNQPVVSKPAVSIPFEGDLELPVIGATGYASVTIELKGSPNIDSETIESIESGIGFEIIKEEGNWWFIENEIFSGWVQHKYCFINLPDVIPSIIYDNTNTYASKFISSGKAIPEITGNGLYAGSSYNERINREEYIMAVLYSMSKKIHLAQQLALEQGDSLKIYEAFRPYNIQKSVLEALSTLAYKDPEVMAGINTFPWNMSWFIATNTSNHQRGAAIDVSLVKIDTKKNIAIGPYSGIEITKYTEYTMPTQIHELSMASAIFTAPVTSFSKTAWLEAILSDSMNDAAIRLLKYCTSVGLTPIASEWWHFNDLDAKNEVADKSSDGKYVLTEIYSRIPQ